MEGYAGFAIGRTIWWDALKGFLDGDLERRSRRPDRREVPPVRAGVQRGGEGEDDRVSAQEAPEQQRPGFAPGRTFRRPPGRDNVGSLPGAMRMRQSLAQFEEAFREEAAESIVRRERLRKQAVHRSRTRRVERRRKQGKLRFTMLTLSIVLTAVVVTIVMFETLAMLAG